jgi:hypothetical protein
MIHHNTSIEATKYERNTKRNAKILFKHKIVNIYTPRRSQFSITVHHATPIFLKRKSTISPKIQSKKR